MKNKFILKLSSIFISAALLVYSSSALSLTITENFSGATTNHNWLTPKTGGGQTENAACLTAGVGYGPLPACDVHEAVGSGALRLTPAKNLQAGGILSDFTFPTNDGLEVKFTTYTFGATSTIDSLGGDGISFFLTDGNKTPSFGAKGGSLGYSCTRNNEHNPHKGEGIIGGYIGLGIDEFGNFLNSGDNAPNGLGYQQYPNYIGIRGAGSINRATYSNTGNIQTTDNVDYIDKLCANPGSYPAYKMLASASLSQSISNNSATSRANATPINYKLKITPDLKLSLWYSYNGGVYQPVIVDQDISANGPLPSSFRFGFAASTGSANNNHEITCFKAAPASKSENSSPISLPNGKYKTGAQIYTTVYHPINWWASLTSNNIVSSTTDSSVKDFVAVNPIANWDASCVLTGGECDNMSDPNKPKAIIQAEAPTERQIITYSSDKGAIPFLWNSLALAQQQALGSGDGKGELRLNYLRGDRTQEPTSISDLSGIFRQRTSVLGDIINSSPAWVGPPSSYVSYKWDDHLNKNANMPENATAAQSYADFKTAYNDRLNVLYVGSNDGFLHGFRSGVYDKTGSKFDGKNITKPNDGHEVIAFMPEEVLSRIHSADTGLDYSGKGYGHNYLNDSTPGTGDLFYNGKWHTWLVSGLGFGGAGIYALDITDPTKFTESNAKNIVIGEWSHKDNDALWEHLGNTFGTPEIRRFHNGKWGAVFGNGWCDKNDVANGNCKASSTGKAGIYIMLVNPSSDNKTFSTSFTFITTPAGTPSSPDGIAYVTSADLDRDGIVDYIYAGDLQGNVWRFDVTGNKVSDWTSSTSVSKLFSSSSTAQQPITSKITVSAVIDPRNGASKIMINFGTGQKTPAYLNNAEAYASTGQSLYGIWDWNLSNWNSKNDIKYEDLSAITPLTTITKSNLTAQTIDLTKTLSNNTVCWAGSGICSAANNKYGWYMDLGSSGGSYEQVIYNPVSEVGAFLVNTYIPGVGDIVKCDTSESSGFTYAINPATGNGVPGFFTNNFTEDSNQAEALNATGSVSIIIVDGKYYSVTKDAQGHTTFTRIYLSDGKSKRISWVQLR